MVSVPIAALTTVFPGIYIASVSSCHVVFIMVNGFPVKQHESVGWN